MSVQDLHNDARRAYNSGDSQRSKAVHDNKLALLRESARESHQEGTGGILKSLVYGGLDGIITTFATVTSVAGAQLSTTVILIIGVAHLFADGLSMGMGDFLSSQAEIEYTKQERRREKWELDNYPQGEKDEMIELYMSKGISERDARTVVDILSKYENAFLDIMMVEELGLMPIDEDDNPLKGGAATFASFVIFGSVPLAPYLINLIPGLTLSNEACLWAAVGLTVVTLFSLGALKGRFVGSRWYYSGFVMALNGSAAAAVGFFLGWGLGEWLGTDV